MPHDLMFRLRSFFRRQTAQSELDEELRSHLEHLTAKYVSSGMSKAEATRRARLDFGTLDQINEECHEAWGISFIESVLQDVRYITRTLLHAPVFTICAALTLALGIGANTAIFSVINTVLLSPLPYPNPAELITARQNDSLPDLKDIQRMTTSFAASGGVTLDTMDFTGKGEPVRLHAAEVDAGLLPTLGVQPALGRWISEAEDVQGGPRNVVLSYAFWRDFLGSDPQVLSRSLQLSGKLYTVIGVMPKDFTLPRERADVIVSLWAAYPEAGAERGVHFMHTYWRLKPGLTLQHAQAEFAQEDHRLAEQFPDTENGRSTTLLPLHDRIVGDTRPALWILFGAVNLVLLVACANFAMLLMARSAARQHELMIRASLGATNARLIRQRLLESALLALFGGAVGLIFAKIATTSLLALKPAALQRVTAIHMDLRVFVFAFAVSLFTGLLFGLLPAWSATRGDIADPLRRDSRTSAGHSSRSLTRKFFVTAELALALILLAGAGLLIRDFARLRSVDPGFNPANVVTMYLQLPSTRYPQIPAQTTFRRELLTQLNALPGSTVAMITDIPFSGNYVGHRLLIDGRPAPPKGAEPHVQTLSVMGDYFGVMQIPILRGRNFRDTDRENHPLVAIVNETFAKQFFPGTDPIGARIDWAPREKPHEWMTIVGVSRDTKDSGLNQPADAAVYAPYSQNDEAWRRWMTLVIRTKAPVADVVNQTKKHVWALDSQLPVTDVQTMDDLLAESVAQQRFDMLLLATFATLALTLAAIGIYGMIAYTVSQRTREIGVYIALGAQRSHIMRLIMQDGIKLTLLGILIGLAGAIALTRLMASLLFAVKPTDPLTLVCVAALLALAALLASYVPARRALQIEPVTALRCE